MFKFIRDHRRKKAFHEPFPEPWLEIVHDRLSFYKDLDEEEADRFLSHLYVFAKDKAWVAAGGLEAVTDEMKVVVSGSAARLVRNLELDSYDRLTEVVVYPVSFALEDDDREILGLAHTWGTIVLAWDAVKRGIASPYDGHDTAVHEFAHALDVEDGVYDGTPMLEKGEDYTNWVRVLGAHYSALKKMPHGNVLRSYGATNEAEFFAVATEAFFEKPKQLKRKAPELYEELAKFYKIDRFS